MVVDEAGLPKLVARKDSGYRYVIFRLMRTHIFVEPFSRPDTFGAGCVLVMIPIRMPFDCGVLSVHIKGVRTKRE